MTRRVRSAPRWRDKTTPARPVRRDGQSLLCPYPLAYAAKIEALIGQPGFVQPQLFQWWNEMEKAR